MAQAQRVAESARDVTVAERTDSPGEWGVEAVEYEDGTVEMALFSGPGAEKRARAYAAWQYGR